MTDSAISIDRMVKALGLIPHPEGGFYREIWRDKKIIPGNRPGTLRNASTTILFLVPRGSRSRLHRLASDETWHFSLGGPIAIIELAPNAPPRKAIIGPGTAGHTVKAGTWFGALPEPGTGYTLAICIVAPGFDFADFEMAEKGRLAREYPQAAEIMDILA